LAREFAQDGVERRGVELCRAAGCFGHGCEFDLCRQVFTSLIRRPL
jgi:hypothetical protein